MFRARRNVANVKFTIGNNCLLLKLRLALRPLLALGRSRAWAALPALSGAKKRSRHDSRANCPFAVRPCMRRSYIGIRDRWSACEREQTLKLLLAARRFNSSQMTLRRSSRRNAVLICSHDLQRPRVLAQHAQSPQSRQATSPRLY